MEANAMDLGVSGKKALVCASSKGLGKAVAVALAQEGVELCLCARSDTPLKEVAQDLQQKYEVPVVWTTADLTSPAGREALVRFTRDALGQPDIVIHNVGGPPPSQAVGTSLDAWQQGFDRLFQSIVQLNQAFLPHMQGQQWGRIVVITSLSTFEPIAGLAVSNAMRNAITAMVKSISDEVAADGITLNCVAPGTILTDRTHERIAHHIAQHGGTEQELMLKYAAEIPAKRLGHPEEFGPAVAFLCSQQASYITGSTLCVDGGRRRAYH
jgi:3-oxoacyl-[acyl-carrier protein] reductase